MPKLSLRSFWLSSALLLLVSALAYLPLLQHLGYYNDDWYELYDLTTYGSLFFHTIFSADRPGRAPVMILLFSLFGTNVLLYNLSAYALRLLGGASLLYIFRTIWPDRPKTAFLGALFFLIYPGFLSQTNGIDFQSHILALFSALLSIALTLKALLATRNWERGLLSGLSILTGWLYLSQMEYFLGLEAFRVLAIYLLLTQRQTLPFWQSVRQTAIRWVLFGLIPAGFLVWRVFFFTTQRRATDIGAQLGQAFGSPLSLVWWLVYLIQDAFNVLVVGWVWPLYNLVFQMRLSETLTAAGLAAVAVGVILFVLHRQPEDETDEQPTPLKEALLVGLLALFAGQMPVILANRHIIFPDYSRYALVGLAGASIILAFSLASIRQRFLQFGLVAILVSFAILTHYANAAQAVSEWDARRNFWWQVAWRAPDIQDGTTLIASYPVGGIQEDYFIWGPANLIYRPERQSSIPIQIRLPAAVLTDEALFQVLHGKGNETQERRGNNVVRDFGNTLVLVQSSAGGCVRVLDGASPDLSVLDPHAIMLAGPYSKLSNVLADAAPYQPPVSIFGGEPPHGWCFYYQAASLARQRGDWQLVAQLGDQALAAGYYPSDRVEWMPFLEAYTILAEKDKFRHLVPILIEEPFLADQACRNLTALGAANNALDDEMKNLVQQSFCQK